MGLKVFNSLPSYIKDRQLDVNEFKQIFFIVILSTHYKNTSIIIKVKYLSNKLIILFSMLYFFKYCI